ERARAGAADHRRFRASRAGDRAARRAVVGNGGADPDRGRGLHRPDRHVLLPEVPEPALAAPRRAAAQDPAAHHQHVRADRQQLRHPLRRHLHQRARRRARPAHRRGALADAGAGVPGAEGGGVQPGGVLLGQPRVRQHRVDHDRLPLVARAVGGAQEHRGPGAFVQGPLDSRAGAGDEDQRAVLALRGGDLDSAVHHHLPHAADPRM
ncbi:MAG: Cytochrome c oxidase polypeptide III, partial [uncultured Gemmatimonadetes bacterium]